MRFFTIILLFALLLFIAPTVNHSQEITTVFSRQTSDIKLYGLPVELNTPNDISDIIAQYQYDAYPLPAAFLPYLDEIVIIEQKEIDEEFSANTSGYTRTYFLDDQYTGSTIYLSDSLFRETTLLHEALHVIDARFQFSASAQFQKLCETEMDNEYNARIITYYDPQYHCSEYFVESYINYLYDPETFQQLQPRTYDFICEANNQINS